MAAMIEPVERRGEAPVAAGAALGVAADATRDALERAELAAAVQGAPGLGMVLQEAAARVDGPDGGLPLVLAQHTTTPDGADGAGGAGSPRVRGLWPQIAATVLDGLTRGPMTPAEDLADVAADPGVPPAEAAYLERAAALAQAHPERAEAIRDRAFHNLADRREGGGHQVDLLTGEPVGPQVLPGRAIEEAGPTVHEGPRIPDEQGAQVLPGPAIEEQRPQVLADPVQEPIHDGVWADPIPKQDPSDHVVMANEADIVAEAKRLLEAPEMDAIRAAAAVGEPITVEIEGRRVQYEPNLPGAGLSMFGENGFLIGPEAFDDPRELGKTVLHELHRLATSEAAGGVSAELARRETAAASDFADRHIDEVLE